MICLTLLLSLQSAVAQAGMVSTSTVIELSDNTYTKADLHAALESEQLKDQLLAMGVDVDQLQDRVASLTPSEIAYLNVQLEDQPAGAGVVGVLLTLFIVFIITDALCATDLFNFVKCINK